MRSTKDTPTPRRSELRDSQFMRRCHDCGKPTPDYRCPGCWTKHRAKNAGNCDGWGDIEAHAVLH